jgi:hypothetical protein
MAIVLALAMVVVLASLAVAFTCQSRLELIKARNAWHIVSAQLAAESGLAFIRHVADDIRLPSDTTAETLMERVHAELSAQLGGVIASGEPGICLTDGVITIPSIDLPPSSFSSTLSLAGTQDEPACLLTVTGEHRGTLRRVSVLLACTSKRSAIFEHGVVSRGRISISGNASLEGLSDPEDASVLSCSDEPVTIELGGHASIAGELYVVAQDASSVSLSGNGLSVGGTSDVDEIIEDHLHITTQDPGFPEVDTSAFAGLATNVVDANTDLSGGQVFTNIRIKAGTDPHFPNDTVINGIVYVEAPNKVTFNSATINGLIATEDGSSHPISECQIDFKAQTTAPGVSALPKTAEFAEIRKLAGTILVAPGFAATFLGSSNSFNGVLAADQLTFRGNADIAGDLAGTILGLANHPVTMSGNANIRISNGNADLLPVGFSHPKGLSLVQSSYAEPTGAGD